MRPHGSSETSEAFQARLAKAAELRTKALAGEQLDEAEVTQMEPSDVAMALQTGSLRDLGCPPSSRRH